MFKKSKHSKEIRTSAHETLAVARDVARPGVARRIMSGLEFSFASALLRKSRLQCIQIFGQQDSGQRLPDLRGGAVIVLRRKYRRSARKAETVAIFFGKNIFVCEIIRYRWRKSYKIKIQVAEKL